MIETADQLLLEWLRGVMPEVTVSLDAPSAEMPEGINLYLLDMAMEPPQRATQKRTLPFTLNYLVTSWSPDTLIAHRLLSEVIRAAALAPHFEIVNAQARVDWRALGVTPRPAFLLKVSTQMEQPESVAPLVREPLVLHNDPMVQLTGRVLGPGDQPMVDARIEAPSLKRTAHTNASGWFSLTTSSAVQSLVVTVKGRKQTVTSPSHQDTAPFIIRFDPTEA